MLCGYFCFMSQHFLKVGGGQSKGWPVDDKEMNTNKDTQQGKLILPLQALTVITEKQEKDREEKYRGCEENTGSD